ncbi:DUF4188 domain-containing protein [Nocardioides eburneiflavus]|uniref:DUF4188 domain-containing protein n=1 Tax=Nocardioides eburneiflavus TaxID=2518372 RepID=A0A4Z1CMG1_9ACTN|nr:DUF4188 domain-containing protein [Nocardioides eburneiflavus]TGN64549.1 DUF4188 domain-containing protein [Nocardioides eburneiflavus]
MSQRRVPRAYAGAVESAPPGVAGGQYVAVPERAEVVVFLIGMRVNRWRRVRSWWPVFVAMPRMLAELGERDLGLLDARTYWSGRVFLVVQHWRSAAELGAYARDASLSHAPAWGAFNRARAGSGDVGIFHETYVVPAAGIESLYGNMPPFGLAAAVGCVERGRARPATRAHQQLGTTEPDYGP